ncbi:hypothetical protein DV737_g3658, partial [Chaetothyriales sp. CBS 132003]
MDGSTILEAVSDARALGTSMVTMVLQSSSPRRPDALKMPAAAAANDFGQGQWHSQRSIWHAPHGSLSSRASDDLTSRRMEQQSLAICLFLSDNAAADSVRQKVASSIHLARPGDGPALATAENGQRAAATQISHPWPSFSTVTPADSRPRGRLNSHPKQNNSAWAFYRDLGFSPESSFLLRNSDLDLGPADEPKARTGFAFDPHFALQNGNPALTPSVRKVHESSVDDDESTLSAATSIANNDIRSIGRINHSVAAMPTSGKAGLVTDASLAGQRFGSAAASAGRGQLTSPTSSKFAKTQHRDAPQMSTQQRDAPQRSAQQWDAPQMSAQQWDAPQMSTQHRDVAQMSTQHRMSISVDTTADSFTNLAMAGPASRAQTSRRTSAPFSSLEHTPSHMHHAAMNGALPYLRLNADPADFQPTATLTNFLDMPDATAVPSSVYPTTWASNPPGTPPQSTDLRSGGSLLYYSSGATPSTGRDSGPSANGSGLSSRSSSMRDFTIVDRKLGALDPFQQSHPFYSSTLAHPSYDFPPNASSVRMNPLAGAYAPFGVSAFSVSGVQSYATTTTARIVPREQESGVGRSPVLEDFRLHYKTNKRYELRDIFSHVVEFSGDQHGSRFIQQKLETANSDEKDQIFKEVQTNCLQLMTDVFGNYVIQKLFEHGNQAQKKSLANHMKGHVLTLSTQMYGCRVVQKALEYVLTDQQASLVKELDGPNKQILKVIRDQNGNHVVQKAIERVPAEHIHFIIEAHRGEAVKLATHTYGCRVIQRILENCDATAKQVVLDELYTCIPPLITDAFGNYVVQHIIEKGDPDGRRRVVSIVLPQALTLSKHKFASNVVEKCIEYADADQRTEIFRRLVGPNDQGQTPVLGLLRDQYGNYVIQKVHSWLHGPDLDALVNEMKLCLPQLKRTSYGKQVMAIEKLLYGVHGTSSPTLHGTSSTAPHGTFSTAPHRTSSLHASDNPAPSTNQMGPGSHVGRAGLATDHTPAPNMSMIDAAPIELPTSRRSFVPPLPDGPNIHDKNWIPVLDTTHARSAHQPQNSDLTLSISDSFFSFPKPSSGANSSIQRPKLVHNYSRSSLAPESVTSEVESESLKARTSSKKLPIASALTSHPSSQHLRHESAAAFSDDQDTATSDVPSTLGNVGAGSMIEEQYYTLPDVPVSKSDIHPPLKRDPAPLPAASSTSSANPSRGSVLPPTSKYNRKPVSAAASRPSSAKSQTATPNDSPKLQPAPPLAPPPIPPSDILPPLQGAGEEPSQATPPTTPKLSSKSNASEHRIRSLASPTSALSLSTQLSAQPQAQAQTSSVNSPSTSDDADMLPPSLPDPDTLPRPGTNEHVELAEFMSQRSTVIFRRFDDVHVKLLFCLQDEIAQLEEELGQLEAASAAERTGAKMMRVMRGLRKVVAEYDHLFANWAQMQANKASGQTLTELRQWLERPSPSGEPSIGAREDYKWVEEKKGDLSAWKLDENGILDKRRGSSASQRD